MSVSLGIVELQLISEVSDGVPRALDGPVAMIKFGFVQGDKPSRWAREPLSKALSNVCEKCGTTP